MADTLQTNPEFTEDDKIMWEHCVQRLSDNQYMDLLADFDDQTRRILDYRNQKVLHENWSETDREVFDKKIEANISVIYRMMTCARHFIHENKEILGSPDAQTLIPQIYGEGCRIRAYHEKHKDNAETILGMIEPWDGDKALSLELSIDDINNAEDSTANFYDALFALDKDKRPLPNIYCRFEYEINPYIHKVREAHEDFKKDHKTLHDLKEQQKTDEEALKKATREKKRVVDQVKTLVGDIEKVVDGLPKIIKENEAVNSAITALEKFKTDTIDANQLMSLNECVAQAKQAVDSALELEKQALVTSYHGKAEELLYQSQEICKSAVTARDSAIEARDKVKALLIQQGVKANDYSRLELDADVKDALIGVSEQLSKMQKMEEDLSSVDATVLREVKDKDENDMDFDEAYTLLTDEEQHIEEMKEKMDEYIEALESKIQEINDLLTNKG